MRYEVFQRRTLMNGLQWYWRAVAPNGRKVAVSGEGYFNKKDACHAIELIRGSPDAPIKQVEK